MPRIEFVFFDAGGGHRAAVSALELELRGRGLPWDVCPTNLQRLLDPVDPLRKVSGTPIEDFYNALLRHGWTLGSERLLRLLQTGIRLSHRRIVDRLAAHWSETRPDLLVSFVPNFNRVLRESFARVFPGRPFVTILTDLADFPPHFWIEPEAQYFICGTSRAVAQARAMGHAPDHIFRVSGMILHPRFHRQTAPPAACDRRRERRRLGLDPDLPTGLVLFGGHGSKAIGRIAGRLDRSGLAVQLILLCGRNRALECALRETASRMPRVVEGFTSRVSDYMRLADFFIGKPGPGSLSEALAMGLPVIVSANAWTLPQERYNAEWILENGVGLVLPDFRGIESAVARMIEPETLARFRRAAAGVENGAVREIPFILAHLLDRRIPLAPPAAREAALLRR